MDWLFLEEIRSAYDSGLIRSLTIQIGIIFGLGIFLDVFQRKLLNEIIVKMEQKKSSFIVLSSLLKSATSPNSMIIYIMAITVSLGLLNSHLEIQLIQKFKDLRGIAILITLGYFMSSFIKKVRVGKLEELEQDPSKGDKTTIQVVSNVTNVLVLIIVGMMILQEFGLSVSGLMAFGGIGGLVVGLSAKEFLADFFGGIVLIADKPFKVGDWIRSPDRNIEGTVEEIGMRRICIRTFDKRPLYIPNSILSTISIENPSRMTNRRIHETIGIRYDDADKMSSITRKVKEMLESHSGLDTSQTLMVNFNSFGDSSLDFFIYCFTKTTDWTTYHGVKHNVLLNIYEIIREEGADIAFPTSVVNLQTEKNPESLIALMKKDLEK